jgi:hypothetical protein
MLVGLDPVFGTFNTESYPSLFNNAADSSDSIMPKGRMVTEYQHGNSLEGGIGA